MNLEKVLNDTKNRYAEIYRKIFMNFYPKADGSGFEERNQSHNFANALLASLSDSEAIVWFETSWHGAEKIDAVVFSPTNKAVFFIEAKRFVNGILVDKIKSLNDDFKRLYSEKRENFTANHLRAEIIGRWKPESAIFEKQYIVCLADVWKEKSDTKLIPNQWLEQKFIVNGVPIEFDAFDNKKTLVRCIGFAEYKNEFNTENTLENYNLLISVTEI